MFLRCRTPSSDGTRLDLLLGNMHRHDANAYPRTSYYTVLFPKNSRQHPEDRSGASLTVLLFSGIANRKTEVFKKKRVKNAVHGRKKTALQFSQKEEPPLQGEVPPTGGGGVNRVSELGQCMYW